VIYIYSDGSSCGKIGAGGYAWIIVKDNDVIYAGYGRSANTSNNLMEMQGAIEGIKYIIDHPIDDYDGVTLISDSQYTINIATGSCNVIKNVEKCRELRAYALLAGIKCEWVRGHGDNEWNCIADSLSRMGRFGYNKRKQKSKKQTRKERIKELLEQK
jgi:ribonuclease HI